LIVDSPLDLIFRDLFFRAPRFAGNADVLLKLEGFNITGSIKIKTALSLIFDLETRGLAVPGRTTIVESSSGNLGLALSLVCNVKGYRFVCVTDCNATAMSISGMRAYGAEVIVVTERDEQGGYLGTRLAKIETLVRNRDTIWLNQYANPANKDIHARETAEEILAEFPHIDWIFVGCGTTGTLVGITERIRERRLATKIVAVEPKGSVTFGGPAARRTIPGIGTSRRPPLADLARPDEIVYVDELATVRMCRDFALEYGLLVGGSTGSVLTGVRQMGKYFHSTDVIVAVSPDKGDQYLETIYNDDWVDKVLGTAAVRV
jgi:N-(2-amino-2-carboxyethyl)-L-glutamate synthase